MIAVAMFMNSLNLWIFGQYGEAMGITAAVLFEITIQQTYLTYCYMTTFKNVLLTEEDMQRRKARQHFIGVEASSPELCRQPYKFN
jgi:hypothetical protein